MKGLGTTSCWKVTTTATIRCTTKRHYTTEKDLKQPQRDRIQPYHKQTWYDHKETQYDHTQMQNYYKKHLCKRKVCYKEQLLFLTLELQHFILVSPRATVLIITSTNEDMSLPLSICLSAGLHKNYGMDFHRNWWRDGTWAKREPITLSRRSAQSGRFSGIFYYHLL